MSTCHFVRTVIFILVVALFTSCSRGGRTPDEEQVRIETSPETPDGDSISNSVQNNLSLEQIGAYPSSVILTGMQEHRLVTVYKKSNPEKSRGYSSSSYYETWEDDRYEHFMPGIDLLFGYNLVNVAHYNLETEKLNFLFPAPVLVKSLYYPSFEQDSLNKKPVNRDYYLVSVYDADTNQDTLLNRRDLRSLYYFNADCTEKVRLLPPSYSAERSQYDKQNDVMYVFARHDENKNGKTDKKEPLHVFWLDLKNPRTAKRLY